VQTEADRQAQHCILASLNKLFPNVTVIAEEVIFARATLISQLWLLCLIV